MLRAQQVCQLDQADVLLRFDGGQKHFASLPWSAILPLPTLLPQLSLLTSFVVGASVMSGLAFGAAAMGAALAARMAMRAGEE